MRRSTVGIPSIFLWVWYFICNNHVCLWCSIDSSACGRICLPWRLYKISIEFFITINHFVSTFEIELTSRSISPLISTSSMVCSPTSNISLCSFSCLCDMCYGRKDMCFMFFRLLLKMRFIRFQIATSSNVSESRSGLALA